MGNIFSKKLSLREQLFNLDERIEKRSQKIYYLRKQKSYYSFVVGIIYLFLLPLSAVFLHFYEFSFLFLGLPILSFVLIQTTVYLVFTKFIDYNENLLKRMKKTQLEQIEQLKRDVDYIETLKIVQKYDKTAKTKKQSSAESVVSTQSLADKLTNIILGDNPQQMCALICEKCFAHNGLVFPIQFFNRKFKCISCGTLNITKCEDELLEKKENDVDNSIPDESMINQP
ncbi:putative membrane protein [Trachipleistophora hominis]|uniref:Endoplasmic reticulum junction formation protein lunapark n=1 Tax=Trachipleistophora hominis TaxID=72359 RepID=L7JXD9_TRAHO|nr:putative membrane protein [Trachipleistophora hominis]